MAHGSLVFELGTVCIQTSCKSLINDSNLELSSIKTKRNFKQMETELFTFSL